MKRASIALLTAALLLCLAGCADGERSVSDADDGSLSAEALLGTYDVSYQTQTHSGSYSVDLRILNDRLTFALYPDMDLDAENSFDCYDPKTGKAQLQGTRQDERGEFTVSCEVAFAETDGTISVSGSCTVVRGDAAEETYTLSGEMLEKL